MVVKENFHELYTIQIDFNHYIKIRDLSRKGFRMVNIFYSSLFSSVLNNYKDLVEDRIYYYKDVDNLVYRIDNIFNEDGDCIDTISVVWNIFWVVCVFILEKEILDPNGVSNIRGIFM